MPTDTLSPAEQTIADAHAARDSFLAQANELFEASRTEGANQLAEKITARPATQTPPAPKPPEAPKAPETAKAPATIPGPPKAASSPAAPVSDPAGPSASQQGTAPDDFSDVPAVDAFDKGPNRPKTNDWRRLHAAKSNIEEQLKAARKEVETLRAKAEGAGRQDGVLPPDLQKQLDTIQQERDSLLQKLEAVAVEKSPRFEAAFKPRIEAALNQAKQAVGPDKADRIASLLQQPESSWRDEQIEAVIREIDSPFRAQKLYGAVAELDRIAGERQALSQRGSELFKQMQAEEAQAARRQQEERQRAVQATFETTVGQWKSAGAEIGDDDLAIARDVFMGNRDLKDIANAAMWVAYGPKAAASALKLQQENERLQAELNKLRGAQPGTANDAGTKLQANDDIPQGTSYADAIILAARKAGLPLS